ncbi:hypothetical protein COCSADRAFT_171265 [Bipolaris sorokiniana ND90Pr]|uniref:Uncharacterized protein n=1 Tax=Cochliobolus sativus (strain ND90Pr / ATCC 201652) TaxID=665912 RepID=M2T5C1_COCSN|nr:uncharacterized protein COCSADRAFT_171265 [Bipolaris sorokiniana ND90Pr]EMD64197.1 hypothetical protein COCSADRAFT_171265 [Bipolaris sorokiniana ND90Pr]
MQTLVLRESFLWIIFVSYSFMFFSSPSQLLKSNEKLYTTLSSPLPFTPPHAHFTYPPSYLTLVSILVSPLISTPSPTISIPSRSHLANLATITPHKGRRSCNTPAQ